MAHAKGESHGCVFFFAPLVSSPEQSHGGGGGDDSGGSEGSEGGREAKVSRRWSPGFVLFVCFSAFLWVVPDLSTAV